MKTEEKMKLIEDLIRKNYECSDPNCGACGIIDSIEKLIQDQDKFKCIECGIIKEEKEMKKLFYGRPEGICLKCWYFDESIDYDE